MAKNNGGKGGEKLSSFFSPKFVRERAKHYTCFILFNFYNSKR